MEERGAAPEWAWESNSLIIAAGVAIFHLATFRVIICKDAKGHFFLPAGRRDANEDSRVGAEREGYEESGYRNRLLPLPVNHRQPFPHTQKLDELGPEQINVTEPVYTELVRLNRKISYLRFWHIAETVPQDLETELNATMASKASDGDPHPYQIPSRFPIKTTLRERIAKDKLKGEDGSTQIYEPHKHEGTGVDEREAEYQSQLAEVEEAVNLLSETEAKIVRIGQRLIQRRLEAESHIA